MNKFKSRKLYCIGNKILCNIIDTALLYVVTNVIISLSTYYFVLSKPTENNKINIMVSVVMATIGGAFFALVIYCIINFIYKRIGKTIKLNIFDNSIHMRGVRIDKICGIKSNTSLDDINNKVKEKMECDIDSLFKYLKKNKIKKFSTKTHGYFYRQLLNKLSEDVELNFKYTEEDIRKIKKLKLNETYNIIRGKCRITCKLLKTEKELTERVFVFTYLKLITAKPTEYDKMIPQKKVYSFEFNID